MAKSAKQPKAEEAFLPLPLMSAYQTQKLRQASIRPVSHGQRQAPLLFLRLLAIRRCCAFGKPRFHTPYDCARARIDSALYARDLGSRPESLLAVTPSSTPL